MNDARSAKAELRSAAAADGVAAVGESLAAF
jgi:hypothetical protein